MKPIKAHCTDFIFYCVRKWPTLFTKSFKNKFFPYSTQLFYPPPSTFLHPHASLLKGTSQWKSVNITVAITPKELLRLHKALKTNAIIYGHESPPTILHTEHPQEPIEIINTLPFNDTNPYDTDRVLIDTQFCSRCTITVIRLASDSIYLSLDFYLNAQATDQCYKVDTSDITEYHAFRSFNPYSLKFRIEHSVHHIEDRVIYLANQVISDVQETAGTLFGRWGIDARTKNPITVASFNSDLSMPYAGNESAYIDLEDTDFYLLERDGRAYSYCTAKFTEESYLYDFDFDEFLADAVHISEDNDPYDLKDYRQSHLYLSLIKEASNQYEKCRDLINPTLLTISKKSEKSLHALLEANLQINTLKKRTTTLRIFISDRCFSPFQQPALEGLDVLIEKIDHLLISIHERKALSNDQLQFKNLRFTKYLSLIVGGFALLQVLLAVIVIDWSSSAPNQNPVQKNFSTLITWLLHGFRE